MALAAQPAYAIVGARNASAAGRKIARDTAAALGKAGYTIVSSLALGIDGETPAASLSTGTIAVLGGGIDHVYPPQYERLNAEVAAIGLIVSEMPFGHRAKAQDFPRRNCIITGLARGAVVMGAAERTGEAITLPSGMGRTGCVKPVLKYPKLSGDCPGLSPMCQRFVAQMARNALN